MEIFSNQTKGILFFARASAHAFENVQKRSHFPLRFSLCVLAALVLLSISAIRPCAADAPNASTWISQLSSSDDDTRRVAAEQLLQLRSPEAVPALTSALKISGNSPATQERIIDALGWIGDKSVVPLLIRLVTHDPDPGIRVTAITALHRLNDPDGIAGLRAVVQDQTQPAIVRRSALVIVGAHQREEAQDLMQQALGDKDPMVRSAAVESLGRLNNTMAKQLLKSAQNDSDPQVSAAATQLLTKGKP